MDATATGTPAPEIGDIVRHDGVHHTVTGWLKAAPHADTNGSRPLLFATRATATHIRLRDDQSATTVGRLADIEPTGERALFAPNTIRAAHALAEQLDGQPTGYNDQPKPVSAPDIGDTWNRPGDGERFVVIGWLKGVPLEPPPPEVAALFSDETPTTSLMVFCSRDEAEFVAGHGSCGVIVPLADVTVTGQAPWPQAHLDHARVRATSLIGEYVTG